MRKIQPELQEHLSRLMFSIRSERHLTQEKMADRYQLSLRSYSDLERGERVPSTLTLLFLLRDASEEEREEIHRMFDESIGELETKEAE